ncbi:MAG: helix-turn-helix transcriptional regulator [Humibacillus sp.]|nr:helix-turn-helix transcriptional regulator [Humibacillus sp.]MDN5776278.1 helix-turn-helix transcriptional regulator [Humibacillus sp.]
MRRYGQFCPIARASEILAERWTPIVLRNLLQGARTFNQIAAGAPGISRALLARRLHELQRAGLIEMTAKPDGHGSIYTPTPSGRALGPVLDALGDWAEDWVDVRPEHATNADPGRVLGSWCHNFLATDRLPERRVVVRFDYTRRGRPDHSWLVLDGPHSEACAFDPGFGDDLTVTIDEPLVFAK